MGIDGRTGIISSDTSFWQAVKHTVVIITTVNNLKFFKKNILYVMEKAQDKPIS
jgi:hypothetical protein